MVKEYKTVRRKVEVEQIIKKSRFISYVSPVDTEEEAITFIDMIKEKHQGATHNVFAFRVGLTADLKRQNDDGEPSGTAGKPVLDVIEKQGLRNIAIVVTRYFGGTKLGAGGLVRAYSNSAKKGVDLAKIMTKKLFEEIKAEIDYPHLGKLQNVIDERERWILKSIEYQENVRLLVAIPNEEKEEYINYVKNLTAGRGHITPIRKLYI